MLSSLEEYDKLDTFEENMNEALENIKKADWKYLSEWSSQQTSRTLTKQRLIIM